MAVPARPNNAVAANTKALTRSGKTARRRVWSPPLLPTAVCTAAVPLPCVRGEQRLCQLWQVVHSHPSGLEEQNHWCCRPSIHPAAYTWPMDWLPISGGGTSPDLVSHDETVGCALQDCCMTRTKTRWVPWETHLKTSHQTEGLTRMCAEKSLGWTKDRHTVS